MTREYLKKAKLTSPATPRDVHAIVKGILDDIEAGGDEKALEYAASSTSTRATSVLTEAEIEAACAQVPDKLKRDIEFAHANVKRFAEAQKATVADFELEVSRACRRAEGDPGGRSGLLRARRALQPHRLGHHDGHHRQGRGLRHHRGLPPRPGVGIAPAIVYAAKICGADKILAMGGVQGVAAMTFGLFGLPKANISSAPATSSSPRPSACSSAASAST
jgi:sulfopropanediol 3-dehydrogenase